MAAVSPAEEQQQLEQRQPQQRRRRLARFAAVADIQHADHEDAPSFSGITRRYRDALLTARDSALAIAEEEEDIEFVLHLGDLVDMKAASESRPKEAFRKALDALSLSGVEQAHVLGNHCLYSWPGKREELHEELGLISFDDDDDDNGRSENSSDKKPFCPERGYYSRSYGVDKKLRLIALDGFDVSIFGRDPSHPKRKLAESILRARNPNNEAGGWFSAEGLVGLERRFVCFGGGVGDEQLRWLSSQLEDAERKKQRCVIAVHQPVSPGTANTLCLLWNFDEVLRTLEPFGKKGVVVATFAGHSHKDGSNCESGVLHRVVRGVIEHERFAGKEEQEQGRCCCHAVVEVFDDGSVVVKGRGCDDSEHFRS